MFYPVFAARAAVAVRLPTDHHADWLATSLHLVLPWCPKCVAVHFYCAHAFADKRRTFCRCCACVQRILQNCGGRQSKCARAQIMHAHVSAIDFSNQYACACGGLWRLATVKWTQAGGLCRVVARFWCCHADHAALSGVKFLIICVPGPGSLCCECVVEYQCLTLTKLKILPAAGAVVCFAWSSVTIPGCVSRITTKEHSLLRL